MCVCVCGVCVCACGLCVSVCVCVGGWGGVFHAGRCSQYLAVSHFPGNYHRRNLNMPREVPRRLPGEFSKDSPITEMGQFQAQLTGAGLKQQGLSIHHVYCSPALRCVQTADAILEGLQADHSVSIKVENGLFEWLAWCQGLLCM